MDYIGPFTFNAVRSLIGALVLLPLVCARRSRASAKPSGAEKRRLWSTGILCGLILTVASNLQQIGIKYTTVGKAGFLTAMYIVLVPILGIFLKQKPTPAAWFSVALAVAGLYLLSCVGVTQINPGDLLTIGCALAFAIQITIVDIYADNVDALRLNTIQSAICAGLSCIVMFVTEEPTWNGIFTCSLELVHVGVLSMGLGYFLQIIGQRHLDTTPATLLMSLESVFAVVLGVLLLNEPIDFWKILGCCLIFAAVILCQIPVKTKKKVHSSN
jgi:drug/metabolite transporter (DMT)-like permease